MTFATLSAIVEMTCSSTSSVIAAITMLLSSSFSQLLAVETFRLGFPIFRSTRGVVGGERPPQATCAKVGDTTRV